VVYRRCVVVQSRVDCRAGLPRSPQGEPPLTNLLVIGAVLAASINACLLGCLASDALTVARKRRRIF
jgi:hypothetical protein